MVLKLQPLFSGSKGNCVYVEGGGARLLVDCGVSSKRVEQALCEIEVAPGELDGILVTHEHKDHIAGLNIFASKYHVRVFANEGTWRVMSSSLTRIPAAQRVIIESDSDFYVNGLNIETYATSHDSASSMCYGFICAGQRGACMTDLGYISKKLLGSLMGTQIICLEANHDETMLMNGAYPQYLKQRIISNRGHLSNRICGEALVRLWQSGLRQATLMHLSQENNTPKLAMETVSAVLCRESITPGQDLRLAVASQEGPVPPLIL